jgi:hypothetical protein
MIRFKNQRPVHREWLPGDWPFEFFMAVSCEFRSGLIMSLLPWGEKVAEGRMRGNG